MPFALVAESLINWVLVLVVTVLLLWAFIDCAFRRADAFVAIGTLQKAVWLLIVGVAALIMVFKSLRSPSIDLFAWIGSFVAAFYLLEVRRGLKDALDGPW